jgi:hypothetical protein
MIWGSWQMMIWRSWLPPASCIWTVLSFLAFVACTILIVALLQSQKSRSQGYNLYLVFWPYLLHCPISFVSHGRLSTCLGDSKVLPWASQCKWFHTCVNMWLNALIVREVYTMLTKSRNCVRAQPPTVRTVCQQAGRMYCFAGL